MDTFFQEIRFFLIIVALLLAPGTIMGIVLLIKGRDELKQIFRDAFRKRG